MAFLQLDCFSESLGTGVTLNVILPQPATAKLGRRRRFPVLYLLHGMLDDHTTWVRQTAIERYAAARNVAVVMPGAGRSFYADMARGPRFHAFMADELPALARFYLPVTDKREQTFVAGLSMGGYGAFKLALTHPERYAAAASLSGALRNWANPERVEGEWWEVEGRHIFGPAAAFAGSANDVYALAQKAAAGNPIPLLYQCCGTGDFLYADNLEFKAWAGQLGLPLTYEEGPGEHNWAYWDQQIQRVLDWLPM
jgi:S-formylglutathione hydrolase FrmB